MIGFRKYEDDFKMRVVREVLSGELTQKEANDQYGIRGHSTILNWIRKFDDNKSFSFIMTPNKKLGIQDLQQRIKELEFQLENERLRSEGFSKMIDIAEQELKITIRKKSNTKLSK